MVKLGEKPLATPALDYQLKHLDLSNSDEPTISSSPETEAAREMLMEKAANGTLTRAKIEAILNSIPSNSYRDYQQRAILISLAFNHRELFIELTGHGKNTSPNSGI